MSYGNQDFHTNKGHPEVTPEWNFSSHLMAFGVTTLWTPATGKKFVVTDIIVSVNQTCTIQLRDGGTIFWETHFDSARGWLVQTHHLQIPYVSTAANNVLAANSTVAVTGQAHIMISGYEVS